MPGNNSQIEEGPEEAGHNIGVTDPLWRNENTNERGRDRDSPHASLEQIYPLRVSLQPESDVVATLSHCWADVGDVGPAMRQR